MSLRGSHLSFVKKSDKVLHRRSRLTKLQWRRGVGSEIAAQSGHVDHEHKPRGKVSFARVFCLVHTELHGEKGGNCVAGEIGLPFQTWVIYESG